MFHPLNKLHTMEGVNAEYLVGLQVGATTAEAWVSLDDRLAI